MVQELLTLDTGDAIAHTLAFDKTTKLLAVGSSDAEIKLINTEKGEVSGALKGHDHAVTSVYFSHDNTALYSAGNDGTVRVWK